MSTRLRRIRQAGQDAPAAVEVNRSRAGCMTRLPPAFTFASVKLLHET